MRSPKERLAGHLIVLVVNIIFGLNIAASKYLLNENLEPRALTFYRMSFACVLFWITSLFVKSEKIEFKDKILLFVCSMCGMTFYQGFYNFGLSLTSAIDVSVISTSTPIIVAFLAAYALKETLTWGKISGLCLGAAGGLLLVFSNNGDPETAKDYITGDILVGISCVLISVYYTIIKPLSEKYTPVTIMKWLFLYASITLFPMFYKDIVKSGNFYYDMNWYSANLLFFVVFFSTYFAYLILPIGLKKIRLTSSIMYNYMQPIVAALVVICLGRDVFSWTKCISLMLVFLGVYVVTFSRHPSEKE